MRKALGILLLLSVTAQAGEVKYHPRKEQKQEQKQEQKRDKEVVLKIQPITPPQPLVKDKEDEEFERQLEALKRQFKLLEYKLKIEKLKAEMEKLRTPVIQIKPVQPQPQKKEDSFRKELLRLQLKRQQDRLLSYKLAYLQNLFAGVMEVNGRKIAFDGQGRKYTVGSSVEGFQIVQIDDDGVVVASPYGEKFRVPLSSSVSNGKKNSGQSFQLAPPQPQPMVEQPPLPLQ